MRVAGAALLAMGVGVAAAQTPSPSPAPPSPMLALPQRATIAPVVGCAALTTAVPVTGAAVEGAAVTIISAVPVSATAAVGAHCLVTARVAPAVNFQLRLPDAGYTGRYLQIGCGGNCGFVSLTAGPRCDDAMARSGAFAVAATDTGHGGGPGATAWARDNRAAQMDFAQRGVHVVALAAKAITAAYYGKAPARSYFQGCSDGGREGMKEAQAHPTDFDGIVAGAPANYISSGFLRFAWQEARNRDAGGAPIWTATASKTLHAAVMTRCDGIDGVVDGQIDAPRSCATDPQVVACAEGPERPGICLSAAQVATARAYYSGPIDAAGRHLWLGGLARGSELTWAGTSRQALVEGYMSDMIYGSARPGGVKLGDIAFTADQAREIMGLGAHYDAYDADLTRFRARGARMIVWEGAADPSAGPNATLNYYQSVRDRLGGLAKARETMRVFILPGVYHCRGGTMPYEANFLGAIVRWVELGEAPDKIVAAAIKPDGGVRTRPIFPYPVAARYIGTGSIDDARSFRGVSPKREPNDQYDWIGTPTS